MRALFQLRHPLLARRDPSVALRFRRFLGPLQRRAASRVERRGRTFDGSRIASDAEGDRASPHHVADDRGRSEAEARRRLWSRTWYVNAGGGRAFTRPRWPSSAFPDVKRTDSPAGK